VTSGAYPRYDSFANVKLGRCAKSGKGLFLEWMNHIAFWHWWILASLLLVLELARPLFVFLWLGFAAAAVGFLLLVFPNTPARAQMLLFGILSVVAVLAWRRYRQARSNPSD
jgi:membrane protein implicated in regulation of membrane protease activity